MSDVNPDLATQEVDEEIRRERMKRLWQATRHYIIGGAVGVVLVVAGREIYMNRVASIEGAHSRAFQAALESAAEEGADAVAVWQAALPELGGSNYASLAQLRVAAALLDAGKVADAMAAFDAVAADQSADTIVRELAILKSAMLQASEAGELDTAKGRLATIAIKGKAWYFSAQEQLALIDLQQGNMDAALQKFTLLADDADTPPSTQARATQFRNFIEAQQFAAEAPVADAADEQQEDATAGSEGDAQ